MTDTCMCPPAGLIACQSSSFFDYTFAQPTCQILPDGSRVENPIYDSDNNISYISYEVLVTCASDLGNLLNLYVIICENIPLASVLDVSMLLDSCPDYQSVPFAFNNPPPPNNTPPTGFRYLQIMVNQNVIPGSSAIFRIALSGNYPFEIPPFQQPSSWYALQFQNNSITALGGGFLFAACPAVPRLTLTKECMQTIENNSATLNYRVVVANTGETELPDVMYTDVLNYDGSNITLGQISVSPDTISVDTSTPGIVQFTGNLGDLPLGSSIEVTYEIPIQAFASPNTYLFSNMATARSGITEGAADCMQTLEVVAIGTRNCCVVDEVETSFIYTLDNLTGSPNTSVEMSAVITIPNNLTVQFTSFGNCTAQFATGGPVPLNTDLTGTQIFITCDILLTEGSSVSSPINFIIVSIDVFTDMSLVLVSNLSSVVLANPNDQILLSVTPIPNIEMIDVNSVLQCQNAL